MIIRPSKDRGSHLPVLMKIVNMTNGPILELGAGPFSTPFLHWACFEKKRKLVSYENNREFFLSDIEQYQSDFHEVHFVENWDKIDISGHWDVAFIDHCPKLRRIKEIKRLANSANYIVVHDTEGRSDRKYKYSTIYHLFKYRYDFRNARPFTTILSNLKDLSQWN